MTNALIGKCGRTVAIFAAAMLTAGIVFIGCVTPGKTENDLSEQFSNALEKSKYDVARTLVENGFDCNRNITDFYYLFSKKDLNFEQKIQIAKKVSNDSLNNPYVLMYVEPKNYEAVIDAFGLDLEEKIIFADNLGTVSDLGKRILHIAVQRREVDLVNFLLKAGVDINALDNNQHTALFYGITSYGSSINWDDPIVEDETTAKINFDGDMPFYTNPRQEQQRQVAIVLALLNAGININQQNYAGWTVLHFAAAAYPEGLRELLIEYGANPEIKTNMDRTVDDILQLNG